LEKKENWDFCKPKGDDLGFWVVSGVFIFLWGISEIFGNMFWWASPEFLWGVFLLGVGSSIVLKAAQKAWKR
jgi:hypothetical protein